MSVVFALATPPAKSAICIFRVSGSGCHCFLKQLFGRDGFSPNHFHVAVFKDGDRAIDQVGLVVFNGPKSYTGEDSFEVYAHGSLGIMSNIVKVFKGLGFDEAPGGEFTKRAFLNNKISLVEAEAVSDLIDSTDERGVLLSVNSLFGELSSQVGGFAAEIDEARVLVEAEIDFSDEGNDYLDDSFFVTLKNLINRLELFVGACVNKNLWNQKNNIVLVGPVNSGKSSVFNRLVGFDRAIVSSTPGTTRDMIESEVFYESNSFSVFDTAGVREAEDLVEKAGIEISLSKIKESDLVLGVFEDFNADVVDYFKGLCKKGSFFSIQNKIDINKTVDGCFDCCVSAKTGQGFDALKSLIKSRVLGGVKEVKYDYLIRDRHVGLFNASVFDLKKALNNLNNENDLEVVAEDLRNARSSLDELVGVKFSDSLLGDIFNSFCIGK